eukprot:6984936-Prymnesium_polylepis.1
MAARCAAPRPQRHSKRSALTSTRTTRRWTPSSASTARCAVGRWATGARCAAARAHPRSKRSASSDQARERRTRRRSRLLLGRPVGLTLYADAAERPCVVSRPREPVASRCWCAGGRGVPVLRERPRPSTCMYPRTACRRRIVATGACAALEEVRAFVCRWQSRDRAGAAPARACIVKQTTRSSAFTNCLPRRWCGARGGTGLCT